MQLMYVLCPESAKHKYVHAEGSLYLQAGAKDSNRASPEQEVQEALLRGLQTMAFSAAAVRHLLGGQGLQPLAALMATTNACLQVRGPGC